MSAGDVAAEARPPVRDVAIVGLGLIGGSLARDLARRGVRVRATDRDPAAVAAAVAEGVAEPLPREGDAPALPASVEALVLAVPVDAAHGLLRRLAPAARTLRLVTDVGGTKAPLARTARELGLDRYVGSHPLAGDHRSGWGASRERLFDGATVYLCGTPESQGEAARADTARDGRAGGLGLAIDLWRSVGARPVLLDAAEHDRRLAWSSHLPQVAATALGLALARHGTGRDELGPGGRDTTRLAGSDPELWAALLSESGGEVGRAVVALEEALAELRLALGPGVGDRVRPLLEEAKRWSAGAQRTAHSKLEARSGSPLPR